MNRYLVSVALLFITIAANADIDVRRYEKTFDCGFALIQAKGAVCASELDCNSISNVSYEQLSYRINGKWHSLPKLSKQLPNGPSILRESDRVYSVSELKCQKNQDVIILYWGGGNCSDGCEFGVTYSVVSGRLIPRPGVKGRWDQVPYVKQYLLFSDNADDVIVTKWIDPPPKSQ
jgi:hypothetical protein